MGDLGHIFWKMSNSSRQASFMRELSVFLKLISSFICSNISDQVNNVCFFVIFFFFFKRFGDCKKKDTFVNMVQTSF